jgi:hypothetical protein
MAGARLFHFSDDPTIETFVPRPVLVPAERAPGREWLNGPLVWAIDETRQAMYFFPRDCPRIVLWQTPATTEADKVLWWGAREATAIAHIEWAWFERLRSATLYRYESSADGFESLDDAGMWVARQTVTPVSMQTISDLPAAMAAHGVELRVMHRLTPVREVWSSSLAASGVRLRNAQDWQAAGGMLRAPGSG